MKARTTHAQAVGALEDLCELLSTNFDQNRALYAAIDALLPTPTHALLMDRADDPAEGARRAMNRGICHARVLLGQTLEQVVFDLDSGAGSLLDTLKMCVAEFKEVSQAPPTAQPVKSARVLRLAGGPKIGEVAP